MKKRGGFALIELVVVLAVFVAVLTSGVVVWRRKVLPIASLTPTPAAEPLVTTVEPVVPGLSENARDLPTTAPLTITPFFGEPGEIRITSSKSLYRRGEKVEVQVVNNSQQAISYYSGPGCGLSFERQVDRKWQDQHLCLNCSWASSKAPCILTTITPKTSVKITRPIGDHVPSGTYRAAFEYVDGKLYSDEFMIKDDELPMQNLPTTVTSCSNDSDCTYESGTAFCPDPGVKACVCINPNPLKCIPCLPPDCFEEEPQRFQGRCINNSCVYSTITPSSSKSGFTHP